MDATTEKLVDYTLGARYEDLPASTVDACKRRLLDTLGCIAGAYDHPVSRAARELAGRYKMDTATSILGSRKQVAPEMAAFANGVMLRVLDLSDMYRTKSGGHPSDVISAALAASELGARDGRSLITAIAVAYEVYCSCCDGIDLNSQGWDQPVYGVVGAVLAAGKLLGLDREQMGHAVALALVPNMALYQTRQGELSSWKGCAGANASRNALFAAFLAQSGFTGAEAPIEGKYGLWDAVGPFEWPLEPRVPPHRIERTHLKCFPVCYHGQSAVWAALGMREQVRLDEIHEIRIGTYRNALHMMADTPSRWAPASAESADHSLPYVVATALLDGVVSGSSFSEGKLKEPRTARLMSRTTVSEDPALTAIYPESSPCHITVRLDDGTEIRNEVRYPKGHDRNPMSAGEVNEKFRAMFESYGTRRQADAVISTVERLEQLEDIGELVTRFVRRSRKLSAASAPRPPARAGIATRKSGEQGRPGEGTDRAAEFAECCPGER